MPGSGRCRQGGRAAEAAEAAAEGEAEGMKPRRATKVTGTAPGSPVGLATRRPIRIDAVQHRPDGRKRLAAEHAQRFDEPPRASDVAEIRVEQERLCNGATSYMNKVKVDPWPGSWGTSMPGRIG